MLSVNLVLEKVVCTSLLLVYVYFWKTRVISLLQDQIIAHKTYTVCIPRIHMFLCFYSPS